jgi:hypothetical protein
MFFPPSYLHGSFTDELTTGERNSILLFNGRMSIRTSLHAKEQSSQKTRYKAFSFTATEI